MTFSAFLVLAAGAAIILFVLSQVPWGSTSITHSSDVGVSFGDDGGSGDCGDGGGGDGGGD